MDRFNVILLTIDAWRPDFVDAHAGVRLTPALDAVADRTVRFERAYCTAPWTLPALVSVFTGQPAAEHGVHFEWSTPPAGGPALAATLRAAGFHAPNLTYLNHLDNYANLGFDSAQPQAPPLSAGDPALTDALAHTPEPFFFWYHYKFVHLPYCPAERFRQALDVVDVPSRLRESVGSGFVVPRARFGLQPEDAAVVRRMYAAGVLEMDAWLAGVLTALQARGLQDRTSLVLTSDHGEELLEHGHVGHASTAHHATLFEEVLRIPLLVVDPRVTHPRRVAARVQATDLHPTLHSLAGVPPPASPAADSPAADLSAAVFGAGEPDVAPDRVFSFHSARMGCPTPRDLADQVIEGTSDGRTKRIIERYEATRRLRFDLERDPGELEPLEHAG